MLLLLISLLRVRKQFLRGRYESNNGRKNYFEDRRKPDQQSSKYFLFWEKTPYSTFFISDYWQGYIKKEPPEINREGPNQKPLTIKPYPMKIHEQYR